MESRTKPGPWRRRFWGVLFFWRLRPLDLAALARHVPSAVLVPDFFLSNSTVPVQSICSTAGHQLCRRHRRRSAHLALWSLLGPEVGANLRHCDAGRAILRRRERFLAIGRASCHDLM
jgi:hypothetical protein